jgi:hypothetical protein
MVGSLAWDVGVAGSVSGAAGFKLGEAQCLGSKKDRTRVESRSELLSERESSEKGGDARVIRWFGLKLEESSDARARQRDDGSKFKLRPPWNLGWQASSSCSSSCPLDLPPKPQTMSSLISALAWVPQGRSERYPKKYDLLDPNELARVSALARVELEDAKAALLAAEGKGIVMAEDGEEGAKGEDWET